MHRSRKETIVLAPENRLLHNDVHESTSMSRSASAAENAQEWAFGSVRIRHEPRQPFK